MRRLIPHALIAAMSVLALLALLLSVRTAERISSFRPPAPGDPAIVKIFRTVVQRSLGAGSFRVDNLLNYQAPDRTATINVSGANEVVIGSTAYLQLGPNSHGAMTWGRAPLTHLADTYYGPFRARQLLEILLGDDSVVRQGDNFVVRQVVAANYISTGNPGQILITYMVYVNGDYVTGVSPLLQGWVTIPVGGSAQHPQWWRVSKFRSPESTFSNYGLVAPITAPPASQTVSLSLCGQSYRFVQQGHQVCSVFG